MAFNGIDVRKSGDRIIFRALLMDSSAAIVTSGTCNLNIYELQSDGTLKTYDFNDHTFKTTAVTTVNQAMTHRLINNSGSNTGLWTYALTTVSGFTVGNVYFAYISHSSASPTVQAREFQYGAAQGDMVIDSNGRLDISKIEGTDATDQIRDSIVSDATRFAGANINATISSRSSHTANNVRDAILSDSTPFAGANINATISSRATQTSVDDVPTVTEFNARTLPTADYFDAATDTVTLADGSLTAAKIASDAITAAKIAGDAITEIQSGLSTLATADLNTLRDALRGVGWTDETLVSLQALLEGIAADYARRTGDYATTGAAMTLAANSITAAVIATDAIDSDALAASALTEVQASAAAALTAYDPPTRTEATADKDEIIAEIGGISGGGSGLTGTRSITLTWEDENGDPVPSVEFTVVGAGSTRAEPDGTKSFGLNDGTYTVVSNTTNGVVFEPFTLVVNGTEDQTITGETSQLPSTSAPGKRTVVVDLTTFSDLEIESVEDVAIKARFRILDSMGLDDNSVTAVVTADGQTIVPRTIAMPDSDADGRSSAGFVPTASMTVPSGYVAAYSFYADNRKIRTVAVGSGASVLLGSLTAVTDNNDD